MTTEEYLSVQRALKIVLDSVAALPAERVPLLDSLQRILAEPIIAGHDLPLFPNSSMDGYAVLASDVSHAAEEKPVNLKVIGDIAAGSPSSVSLVKRCAARITTGAPLPDGADAVVPVEHTDEPWRGSSRPLPEIISIKHPVRPGDYVRWPGEDVKEGRTVLAAGSVIRPQEIGLMAALGHDNVLVTQRPKVGILATGDELVDIAQPLNPGKIRDSNSYIQAAQVASVNAEPVNLGVATDTEEAVRERLQEGLTRGVDLFVSSAGVSVGAYDVVKTVIERDGLLKFWRVRMRPGKPLTFGQYQGVPYLGLPGNPVSAMVSFERFARPAILKMAGHKKLERPSLEVRMRDEVRSDGRESYIRAIVKRQGNDYWATTTGGQGSHMVSSLVKANALVIVPEGVQVVKVGKKLTAIMIDWPEIVF